MAKGSCVSSMLELLEADKAWRPPVQASAMNEGADGSHADLQPTKKLPATSEQSQPVFPVALLVVPPMQAKASATHSSRGVDVIRRLLM